MINKILALCIIVLFVFYAYSKLKQVRTPLPIAKKWHASRALFFLGLLVVLFGINQMLLFPGALTYAVGAAFLAIGGFAALRGWRAAAHYKAFLEEERELNTF